MLKPFASKADPPARDGAVYACQMPSVIHTPFMSA